MGTAGAIPKGCHRKLICTASAQVRSTTICFGADAHRVCHRNGAMIMISKNERANWRRRALFGSAAAAGVLASNSRGLVQASTTTTVINVKDFGATGNGTTDDYQSLMAAINSLRSGGVLLFPPGVYLVTNYLSIQGKRRIQVTGYGATISSSFQSGPIVVLYANNDVTFTGFRVQHSSISGGRSGAGFGIKVSNCTSVTLSDCLITQTTSAGIVTQASSGVRIDRNTIRDTLADGIHTTGGSTDVIIASNLLSGTGDDAIPVVSYRADLAPCRRVVIYGNTVLNSAARGIDVVGGVDVCITGNVVDGTRAAGIMVAQETSYSTFGVQDVSITGNIVVNAVVVVGGGAVSHGAIMVDCADASYPISGVNISGNTVRVPRLAGFVVSGDSSGLHDICLDSNVFIGPSTTSGQAAFLISAASGVYLRSNLASKPSGPGFRVTATGTVVVSNNDVRCVRSGWPSYSLSPSTTSAGNRSTEK